MNVYNSHVFQGGVNDEVTITAYITAAFLELGLTVQVRESYNFFLLWIDSVGRPYVKTIIYALIAGSYCEQRIVVPQIFYR